MRSLDACVAALTPAASLLRGDVLLLDATAAGLTLAIDGRDVSQETRARLLFDQQQQSTWLLYQAPPARRRSTSMCGWPPMASRRWWIFTPRRRRGRHRGQRDPSTGVTHWKAPRTGAD